MLRTDHTYSKPEFNHMVDLIGRYINVNVIYKGNGIYYKIDTVTTHEENGDVYLTIHMKSAKKLSDYTINELIDICKANIQCTSCPFLEMCECTNGSIKIPMHWKLKED